MKRLAIVVLGLAAFGPQLAHARCSEILTRYQGTQYICDGGVPTVSTGYDSLGDPVAAVAREYADQYQKVSGASFDEWVTDPRTASKILFYYYPTTTDWESGGDGTGGTGGTGPDPDRPFNNESVTGNRSIPKVIATFLFSKPLPSKIETKWGMPIIFDRGAPDYEANDRLYGDHWSSEVHSGAARGVRLVCAWVTDSNGNKIGERGNACGAD